MQKLTVSLFFIFLAGQIDAQVSGNANYQQQVKYTDNNINISVNTSADLTVSVKGMANVKADAFVAIFSVTQLGVSAKEVNDLIDSRINNALENIKKKATVETVVDMISFVPMYEYEEEKKIFSKRTYNEVPAGFEVKKNIHVKYTSVNDLNEIIAAFSMEEIYDLVRVDYFSNSLEAIKKELATKAKAALNDKFKSYQTLLGENLESARKQMGEGYKIVLPVEMYKSYQAYNSSSLYPKKGQVQQANKGTTMYYQPVIDKEFDFVINPTVLEPVIQVMYEIKLQVYRDTKTAAAPVTATAQKPIKEFYLVTPVGDIKQLPVGN